MLPFFVSMQLPTRRVVGALLVGLGAVAGTACSQSVDGSETVARLGQALGADGDPCTLADASSAGLQGDCNPGLWCNLQTNKCQAAFLAPGQPIPLPPDGTTSGCTDIAASSACASGVCNTIHKACGCLVDQDCSGNETCNQQTFDCVPPAPADAGSGDSGMTDGATATDAAAPDSGDAGDSGPTGGCSSQPNGCVSGIPSAGSGGGCSVGAARGARGDHAALALVCVVALGVCARRRRRS